ncbi:hypothetical protein [Streptococcus moroccensis]|uniref:Gas vesicle protein n=1 Tax=Streptococcus moroccensis TaxID=1451356 RepID=A0ABT9YT50_9STRE|nr:hypothetical protein [Streptococcus moroccensis]MDQ0222786.1 gas vesicle protein [Streptococcus moroccensis]
MTKKKSNVLFGLGLLATAASLAYLRLTPEQKKKIGDVKDDVLKSASNHVDTATESLKDVTDSIVDEAGHVGENVSEKVAASSEKAQTNIDDVINLVEEKLEDFRKYLQDK